MNNEWSYGSLDCERIEKCIRCGKLADSICKYCGVFCRDHGIVHRHEMKSNLHATEQIGFDYMVSRKQQSSTEVAQS